MTDLRFNFGKYKNRLVNDICAEDPSYIGFLMWGPEHFRASDIYKQMLAQGLDKYSPYVGFGQHKGRSIAAIQLHEPDYYNWIYLNKGIRAKCSAINRWMIHNHISYVKAKEEQKNKIDDSIPEPEYENSEGA